MLLYIIIAVVFWILPCWITYEIGEQKNRAGFSYGFFLSWLGVITIALLPALPPDESEQSQQQLF
ncbi:MAG TPA: hypothetical protein VFQ71_01805 [Gaiellales bacterium]|jgi:hypothetical protein|nr:hypothetical protein [Gaiellales bacterium]